MTLQEMRETWRPRLAHDLRWIIWGSLIAAFVVIVFRPEAAASVVALEGLVFGYVASLFGLRQWGKNAGAS